MAQLFVKRAGVLGKIIAVVKMITAVCCSMWKVQDLSVSLFSVVFLRNEAYEKFECFCNRVTVCDK